MSIYTIGNGNAYMYNTETKILSKTDSVQKDFGECLTAKADEKSSREILQSKIEEMQENIETGDVDHEPVFQIGASEFTEKEWNQLLENFDEVQEDVREAIKLEYEKALKELEEETQIQKEFLEKEEEEKRIQKEIDATKFLMERTIYIRK